jgi:hypothetical protein
VSKFIFDKKKLRGWFASGPPAQPPALHATRLFLLRAAADGNARERVRYREAYWCDMTSNNNSCRAEEGGVQQSTCSPRSNASWAAKIIIPPVEAAAAACSQLSIISQCSLNSAASKFSS